MKSKQTAHYFLWGGVAALAVCAVFGIYQAMRMPTQQPPSSVSPTPDQQSITVTSPHPNDTVDGQVSVQGKVSRPGEYTIHISDDLNILGEKTVTAESGGGTFSALVPVTSSPAGNAGEVVITVQGADSPPVSVPVFFKLQEAAERVRLQSPLPNQLMKGASVGFRGSMKGFFEGVMHVRLKDDKGAVLFTDTITAADDNYEQFAPFDKTVKYGTIVANGLGSGSWEIYDVSAKDGSETVLLSVPIRFKE